MAAMCIANRRVPCRAWRWKLGRDHRGRFSRKLALRPGLMGLCAPMRGEEDDAALAQARHNSALAAPYAEWDVLQIASETNCGQYQASAGNAVLTGQEEGQIICQGKADAPQGQAKSHGKGKEATANKLARWAERTSREPMACARDCRAQRKAKQKQKQQAQDGAQQSFCSLIRAQKTGGKGKGQGSDVAGQTQTADKPKGQGREVWHAAVEAISAKRSRPSNL